MVSRALVARHREAIAAGTATPAVQELAQLLPMLERGRDRVTLAALSALVAEEEVAVRQAVAEEFARGAQVRRPLACCGSIAMRMCSVHHMHA